MLIQLSLSTFTELINTVGDDFSGGIYYPGNPKAHANLLKALSKSF